MKKQAIITTRLEPTHTFLARDLEALPESADWTLYTLSPDLDPVLTQKRFGPLKHKIRRFPPHKPSTWSLALKFFFQHPLRTLRAFSLIFSIHFNQPRQCLILVLLFPSILASATEMKIKGISHVHGYWANYAASAALLTATLLNTTWSFSVHANDMRLENERALTIKAKKAARIMACSLAARNLLLTKIKCTPDQLQIQHHGLPLTDHPYQIRQTTRTKPLEILSTGRIVPKKGFYTLVQALGHLASKGIQTKCRICGPMTDKAEVKKIKNLIGRTHSLAHIDLPGWQDTKRIQEFMKHADLYIQPSLTAKKTGNTDGIPNAMLEAMAAGVPVIASKMGGLPEVIEDRKTGLLVPEGDYRLLANAILNLAGHPKMRQELARNARQKIEEEFDTKMTHGHLVPLFASNTKPEKQFKRVA